MAGVANDCGMAHSPSIFESQDTNYMPMYDYVCVCVCVSAVYCMRVYQIHTSKPI